MAVSDYLQYAARRSDCLLAVVPHNGISVINPVRESAVFQLQQPLPSDPSAAERAGYILRENITSSNGYFQSLDPTLPAGIVTPLDLRGNHASKTFIAKVRCNAFNDGNLYINPIFTQGFYQSDHTEQTFNITIRERTNNSQIQVGISSDEDDYKVFSTPISDDFFDASHVIAVVFDYNADPGYTYCSIYLDGTLVKNAANAVFGWSQLNDSNFNNYLAIRREFDIYSITDMFLFWAIIFDSALTEDEIKLFK